MIIPIFISFITSLIVLNVAVLPINRSFEHKEIEIEKEIVSYILDNKGSVLGTQETNFENYEKKEEVFNSLPVHEKDEKKVTIENVLSANNIFVETPRDISSTVIRVVDGIKKMTIASLEPFKPINRLPVNGDVDKELIAEPYNLKARSGAVYDVKNNTFVFRKEASNHLPIASITKLMTALVFLDNNPGFDQIYTVTREDRREGGRIYVYQGDQVYVKDLFYLSLVGSGNSETVALVHSTGMTEEEFLIKMNDKAKSLGLYQTGFKDLVGLSISNYSTAKDISLLALEALSHIEIREATLTSSYSFKTQGGRSMIIDTTDDLLINFPENGIKLLGGKTGYTEAAGYCFVGGFIDENGRELISVVLGSNTSSERFSETKGLVSWTFENIDK